MKGRKRFFSCKRLEDSRALLNLGCGPRANPNWINIDFSWYARLRRYPGLVVLLRSLGLFSPERYAYFLGFPDNVIVWDLRKGIPFNDDSFNAVYSSHLLEHLDRAVVGPFLIECRRVLKPGGVLRIVVPDLEIIIITYVDALQALERGDLSMQTLHQQALETLFGQMVLREASATAKKNLLLDGWRISF